MRHMFMVQDFRTSLIKGGYAERIDSPELEKQEKRELRKMVGFSLMLLVILL